jgi:hypothetical protein
VRCVELRWVIFGSVGFGLRCSALLCDVMLEVVYVVVYVMLGIVHSIV